MNTFVRTLGEPNTLATWLDILRETYDRGGTDGQKMCRILQSYRRHSHYGHCQLLMLVSGRNATEATVAISDAAAASHLKHAPHWDLLLSIWQPLATNSSFTSAKRTEPQLLVEPPHSHPFSFVSKIVVGALYQSTYRSTTQEVSARSRGRYAGVSFTRVDRTWPPHKLREPAWLETVEDRIALNSGDSYFLPADVIHDVEMDLAKSSSRPAISLMLSAESTVLADVYLESSILAFHDANPDLKDGDAEMSVSIWRKVLRDTAAYLQGGAGLRLPSLPLRDSFLMH